MGSARASLGEGSRPDQISTKPRTFVSTPSYLIRCFLEHCVSLGFAFAWICVYLISSYVCGVGPQHLSDSRRTLAGAFFLPLHGPRDQILGPFSDEPYHQSSVSSLFFPGKFLKHTMLFWFCQPDTNLNVSGKEALN